MLAVRVHKKEAEKAIKKLSMLKLIDSSRKIIRSENYVEIPIKREPNIPIGNVVVQKNPVFRKMDFKKREVAKKVKGKVEFLGDVIIIGVEDKKLAEELLKVFKAKSVVYREKICDEFREPKAKVLAGSPNTETIYKENGCLFKLDPLKVMFSTGNMGERERMAYIARRKEVVVDMFAGVGQFTIPIAKHSKPKLIYAIDKNPVAYRYLVENIRLNKLKNVVAINSDCRDVDLKNVADRIVMGYFFEPLKFLNKALSILKEKGIIHFHDLVKKEDVEKRKNEIIKEIEKMGLSAEIGYWRFVKSYAPRIYHVVFDIKVKGG